MGNKRNSRLSYHQIGMRSYRSVVLLYRVPIGLRLCLDNGSSWSVVPWV